VTIKNILAIATVLMVLAACKSKGPEPLPLPTTTISTSVVQVCVEEATGKRYQDKVCDDKTETFMWVFIVDGGGENPYIQAVGQIVPKERYRLQRPAGVEVSRVPADGAYFTR
jgi:predicted small lipoprotein YifL